MEDHSLLEFAKLKDEQIGRLTYRDTLFYFTMTIIGGALALACSNNDTQAIDVLLIVPFAAFIAGVSHIACDLRIEDIGIYIRDELAILVADRSKVPPHSVFVWEKFFRSAQLHTWRKLLLLLANEMLYSLSGVGALFFYLMRKGQIKGGSAVTAFTLQDAEMWLWWSGLGISLIMALLIFIFSLCKSNPHKQSGGEEYWWSLLLRRVVTSIGVLYAGYAAFNGLKTIPFNWLRTYSCPEILPLPVQYCVSAFVALTAGMLLFFLCIQFQCFKSSKTHPAE